MRKVRLQYFASGKVYPVHNNKFYVSVTGRGTELAPAEAETIIRGLENFNPSFNSSTETWTPMDEEGWERNAVTGKGLNIGFTGKRQYGDAGNDYIAGLMLGIGTAVESVFKWELPSGASLEFKCIINVTKAGGGDSTNIDGLEFEILSDGKPTFTPAT